MFGKIAAFEIRYQVKSPLFAAAAGFFLLAFFFDMSVIKVATIGGGNVLFNSPHSIIVSHLMVSLLFLFVGAAFVSNVVVRDDQTGFGPLIRCTRITKFDYLFGRFAGAFAAGALMVASVPLGAWLGTLMPFADGDMIGPNRLAGFAYGYGLFALPNALIISAILFALATATRSTAGTFVGVIVLFVLYLVGQSLMEGETQLSTFRVFADPFGMTAYMAASRYLTAAELNAGAVPITGLLLQSRLLWVCVSIALLAATFRMFRFSDRGLSRRQRRMLPPQTPVGGSSPAAGPAVPFSRLADPRFNRGALASQFAARLLMEVRFIVGSPVFLILIAIGALFTFATQLTASGWLEIPFYPLTFLSLPDGGIDTILIIIATYYGGELVWRDRERGMHEIIDATPLPAVALMLPKMIGLALVLFATVAVGVAASMLVQWLKGGVELAFGDFLLWYLLPTGINAALIAVLAVFVQALSPGKYAGWGVMVLYILLLIVGPGMGLEHPLAIYGKVPAVPLSDMAGAGIHWQAAWWFRLFWAATAALLLAAVHLLWPRGTEQGLKPKLRRLPGRLTGRVGLVTAAAAAVFALSGTWIVYNTLVLNPFGTSAGAQRYFAEYEKRFFRYAQLPQPTVRHVQLEVALYPEAIRAEVRGRYRLVNETRAPITRVHVRLVNARLELAALDFPGARLERNDEEFDYRIYRLDAPMLPGEARTLAFHTRRQQVGFAASGAETGVAANGTDLNSLELAPRIGMDDSGLIEDPAARRRYRLPARPPFPRLDDLAATRVQPNGDISWTTADITVSTAADQVAIAPGRRVSDRVENGRRIARFVSMAPIKNLYSIHSGRYAVRRQAGAGIENAVYFHPAHGWNVDRILAAMRRSTDYYSRAFGPYQFDGTRVVETPAYRRGGGQAFPNTIAVGEGIFAMDLRNPAELDMVTMLVAHEVAHQWWGHQVVPARMQGGAMLGETLSQYSALMVLKELRGESNIRRFLGFQLDRYLSERRTQVLEEQPLVSVGNSQNHIAYGKGPLVFYLLQERMGEEAVNRALRRFVDRYRFTVAPYPRSVDLVALLRDEAGTPENQRLITDLFERITLYDLKAGEPSAVRRADGRWDVSLPVEARKFHASGKGEEKEAPLDDLIAVGLFTADPGGAALRHTDVIRLDRKKVRSGKQVFRFVTGKKPTHAGIDPYISYIDRDAADNVAPVGG